VQGLEYHYDPTEQGIMQSVFRGGYYYYRSGRIWGDDKDYINGDQWSSGFASTSGLFPGLGDVQAMSTYYQSSNSYYVDTIWRSNQGYTRYVPTAGTAILWDKSSQWYGPTGIETFPGSGELQALSTYYKSNKSILVQTVWRGDVGYVREVPVSGGIPAWNYAGAWNTAYSLSDFPGSGSIVAVNELMIQNDGKLFQSIWRGDEGYNRLIPVSGGTPDFASCN
jgi:hypothetical protein